MNGNLSWSGNFHQDFAEKYASKENRVESREILAKKERWVENCLPIIQSPLLLSFTLWHGSSSSNTTTRKSILVLCAFSKNIHGLLGRKRYGEIEDVCKLVVFHLF